MTNKTSNIYRYLLLQAMMLLAVAGYGQHNGHYYLSGMVRDVQTMEPVPFVSVTAGDHAIGTLTNEKGIFELSVPDDTDCIIFSCLGYEKDSIKISKNRVNLYAVMLKPLSTQLDEVVVRRQKYSKKNNPAVDFARKLRTSANLTDPLRNDYYNYDKHEIITMGLNDVNEDEQKWLFKKMPFLKEHIDTSEISGKPVLKFLIKEKASDVHYQREPKSTKEIVTGMRMEGIDEDIDAKNMQTILEDIFREIDLYDNDITILHNKFVSPLSRIAPDFYKFYLTDTIVVDGERCIVLSFYPHNTSTFGFNGQLYVPENDSTMFIKKVTMRTPRNINLNFIENLYISQTFERAADGSRLKTNDDLTVEAKLSKKSQGLYVRRNTAYDHHTFDAPSDLSLFDILQPQVVENGADGRSDDFWSAKRILYVTENEKSISKLMTRLRAVPGFYWAEKTLKVIVNGYVQTGRDSKFDIGPLNTFISSGPVEHWRLRFGGMTTANLSRRWFGRMFVAYGTGDHKWKYGTEIEYSFTDKDYHSREFPIHSLRLSSIYDINELGQQYKFTNPDNFVLSIKRIKDMQVTYQWVNKLEYTLELQNNFSLLTTLKSDKQFATPYVPLINGYGQTFKDYLTNSLSVQLRFAPGEKYYQSKSNRIPINNDAPVILLTHTIAPKGWFGTTYMVNKTELSFQKRIWLSAFGYTDILLQGGHVWSKSPYINLLIPSANLSYTIQPESYAMMDPLEFINDSYASCDLTYWLNGALFNYIPGVKKLKLREVVNFKALWGNLSDKNDPEKNPDLLQYPSTAHVTKMTNRPYMEISAGLDNIFKCIRLDYVWRLSYLDVPYFIDRHGLRVAMHLTF